MILLGMAIAIVAGLRVTRSRTISHSTRSALIVALAVGVLLSFLSIVGLAVVLVVSVITLWIVR